MEEVIAIKLRIPIARIAVAEGVAFAINLILAYHRRRRCSSRRADVTLIQTPVALRPVINARYTTRRIDQNEPVSTAVVALGFGVHRIGDPLATRFEAIPRSVNPTPASSHCATAIEPIPGSAQIEPSCSHAPRRIGVIPCSAVIYPPSSHCAAVFIEVIPRAAFENPAKASATAFIEVIPNAINILPARCNSVRYGVDVELATTKRHHARSKLQFALGIWNIEHAIFELPAKRAINSGKGLRPIAHIDPLPLRHFS